MADPADALRLLVVDDDATARALVRSMLLQIVPDARVDVVESGEQAVDLLRRERYQGILADYQLEWMNGIDLLEIAARDHADAARILFTGHGSMELAREAIDRARIHAFILKPLRTAALREAVRHVVGVRVES